MPTTLQFSKLGLESDNAGVENGHILAMARLCFQLLFFELRDYIFQESLLPECILVLLLNARLEVLVLLGGEAKLCP